MDILELLMLSKIAQNTSGIKEEPHIKTEQEKTHEKNNVEGLLLALFIVLLVIGIAGISLYYLTIYPFIVIPSDICLIVLPISIHNYLYRQKMKTKTTD